MPYVLHDDLAMDENKPFVIFTNYQAAIESMGLNYNTFSRKEYKKFPIKHDSFVLYESESHSKKVDL